MAHRFVITAVLAIAALLAACGGSQPPIGVRGVVPPETILKSDNPGYVDIFNSGYVDVSNYGSDYIEQYSAQNRSNAKLLCEIGPISQAIGMTSGPGGTLYVVGDGQHGPEAGVFVFPEKSTKASANECGPSTKFFKDFNGFPFDPAIDGTTLYVSNTDDGISLPPSIVVFDTTKTYATGDLTDPTAGTGYDLTVDAHHNLFWSTWNRWVGGGQVIEFQGGKMPGKVLAPTIIKKDNPGSVLVDQSGNLLLLDASRSEILIYAPPYNKKPFTKLVLRGSESFCAFGVHDRRLFCLDYAVAAVDVYSYPQRRYLYSFNNGINASAEPSGITVRPALKSSR